MASADRRYVDPSALRSLYLHDDRSSRFFAWRRRTRGRRMLDLAAELSQEHTAKLGTRTLDVLHVASALALGSQRFVTYDTRQAALAKAVKLRVLAP